MEANNYVSENSSVSEDGDSYPLEHSYGAAAESADESVDPMDSVTNKKALDGFYDEPNEIKATEDVGKEDMFVDCPDEIETSESQQISEEKENVQDDQVDELDSGVKAQHLMAEIEMLRDKHEKSVSEKERLAQEYEEERTVLTRELTHLCDQLKALDKRDNYPGENGDGFIDELQNSSLHDIINECSRIVKHTSDERLQSDSVMHIEENVNSILAILSTFFGQEYLLSGSYSEKISNIETSVNFLVERYNFFNYETHQIRGYLSQFGYAADTLDEYGTFSMLRDSFLELKRKEENMIQNINNLEDENRKLVEKLEEQRSDLENAKTELGKLGSEVELEKHKCANAKEKLGMAVTKGKALVQQRDSLKQLLSEKTSELEKLSTELQEKSSALEAAEQLKHLLAGSEKLAASLQETLAEKDNIIQQCGEILFETEVENLEPSDITEKLRLVVEEYNAMRDKSRLYHKVSDILSVFDFPETLSSSELDVRVRWLVDSFYMSKEEAMKFQSEMAEVEEAAREEIDHLTSSLLSEKQEKSYLEAKFEALRNKSDAHDRIRKELTEVREAFESEIQSLHASVLQESQEKNNILSELENLRHKYEDTISLVKDKIVNMLVEVSGDRNGSREIDLSEDSGVVDIVENCLTKIREKTTSPELSLLDTEIFENFQSLLYIKDQELSLHKLVVEENEQDDRLKVKHLSDELDNKSQELNALKDEKEKLEERCSSVKEKLSMAIKKGKGLHQERESLKGVLNEKNAEIDKLKSELQESVFISNERQDQITKLSLHLEQIETDLTSTREHVEQLEQFLAESNRIKQRVMESIEVITAPPDLVFEQPLDKVSWLVRYVSECENAKLEVEQVLKKAKDESTSLFSELSECNEVKKSLEDDLSVAESNISRLLDEKKELELSKALLEDELHKAKVEASSHASEFEEVLESRRELEEALSVAENKISRFINERDNAEESRILAEEQLLKLKEEFSIHISKLSDAEKTIRSLEDSLSEAQNSVTIRDALSVAETNVSQLLDVKEELELSKQMLEKELEEVLASKRELEEASSLTEKNISKFVKEREMAEERRTLAEEQLLKLKEDFSVHATKLSDAEKTIMSLEDSLSEAQKSISLLDEEKIERANLESEMKLLKEESDLLASKVSDASLTIKSLEEALSNSEKNAENLLLEKNNAEQEISTLKSTLQSLMNEIAGTRGNIEDISHELSDQVSRLHSLMKDNAALSLFEQCVGKTFGRLDNMDSLIKEIGNSLLEMDSDVLPYKLEIEDGPSVSSTLPSNIDIDFSNDDVSLVDSKNIVSRIERINEGFDLKIKMLCDQIGNFTAQMDKSTAALMRRLLVMKDGMTSVMKHVRSLEQRVMEIETDNQRHEANIASMDKVVKTLSSACLNAVKEIESDANSNILALRSVHQIVNLEDKVFTEVAKFDYHAESAFNDNHVKVAERLIFASRTNHNISEWFKDVINQFRVTMDDVHNKLEETQLSFDEISRDRDLHKTKISKLETDLEEQKKLCHEMSIKIDDYQEKEDDFLKREANLSTSLAKFNEWENSPLSASQVKTILDKMSEIELPNDAIANGDTHNSSEVRKLFYIVDSFSAYLDKVDSLSHEKEDLQSIIDELALETERLKKQVENHLDKEDNLEPTKELLELESELVNIVRKVGGSNIMDDYKGFGVISLLPMLDKLVMAIMEESEIVTSKNEELGVKLLGTQKVVDDLSKKVELLENSVQSRSVITQEVINQERGTTSLTSLPIQSEISEVPDMGMSSNIPLVPSAAHARTLRKGSSDHLALNIDSDSERLISNKDSDEDKGHAFKSLNTSGLVPRQGRAFADRIDGIWVSGSRALMSHPRGRLGLIAYWLLLHIWLLGSIL